MYPEINQVSQINHHQVNILITSLSYEAHTACKMERRLKQQPSKKNIYEDICRDMQKIRQRFRLDFTFEVEGSQVERKRTLKNLIKIFQSYDDIYLFYIGHADNDEDKGRGNRITLAEICSNWQKYKKSTDFSHMSVIMDSCYNLVWGYNLMPKFFKHDNLLLYVFCESHEPDTERTYPSFLKCLFRDEKDFQYYYEKALKSQKRPLKFWHQTNYTINYGEMGSRQMIQLIKSIRSSFNWITLPNKAQIEQEYRKMMPGFIIEAECEKPKCPAYGKLVLVNKGFGKFNIGRELFGIRCPKCGEKTKKAACFYYYRASIEIEGIKDDDGSEVQGYLVGKDDKIHAILDMKSDQDQWSFMEVIAKSL